MVIKCNPFYVFSNEQDKIEIINYYTGIPKYRINSPDAQGLYNEVIKKLLDEKKDLNEVISAYSKKTGNSISKLINSMGNVLVNDEGKEALFYERLFKLVGQVKGEYPGLDTERLRNFMEESILTADAYVFYNVENEKLLGEFSTFPFRRLSCVEIASAAFDQIKAIVNSARNNDWILILSDDLKHEKIQFINRQAIKLNKKMFIIEMNSQTKRCMLGPILVPNSTGCVNCISECEFDKKILDFKEKYEIEESDNRLKDIIQTNVYDEILNYELDSYSNFSTEYSYFIGTQYEFDFNKRTIKRREILKDAKCLSC